MVFTLGPELWDMVIDHLHDDHASLASCALTCRSMRAASQFHLFFYVKLHSRVVLPLLQAFDSSPALALHCRHLFVPYADSILPEHWRALVASLRNVQKLEFYRLQWGECPGDREACIASGFQQVTKLSFEGCHFLSKHAFLRTLRAWPRVHTLTVRSLTPRFEGSRGSELPIPIRDLALACVPRLRAHDFDLSGLQSLDIILSSPMACTFLAEACNAAGASLSSLTVRLTRYFDGGAAADLSAVKRGLAAHLTLALARNTHLCTLVVATGDIGAPGADAWIWTHALFQGISLGVLQNLTCTINVYDGRGLGFGDFDWQSLRNALRRKMQARASEPESAELVLRVELTSKESLRTAAVATARECIGDMCPHMTTVISWMASP